MTATRRDHLVDTAARLFARHGFHATGIDRILAEAGVAKMTLYKHFRSKDELILAALRRRDEAFRNWFLRRVEARGGTPRDRLLAVFDVLAEWFEQPDFVGCMFVAAAAEFHAAEDPIHAMAAEHKRLLLAFLRDLAAEAGARDPENLAQELSLLMEGATALAHVCGERNLQAARHAAELLIEEALQG